MPLDNDTLVLQPKVFLRREDLAREREKIAAQFAKGDGVVVVPCIFDMIFVPKGTTVKIEDMTNKYPE